MHKGERMTVDHMAGHHDIEDLWSVLVSQKNLLMELEGE